MFRVSYEPLGCVSGWRLTEGIPAQSTTRLATPGNQVVLASFDMADMEFMEGTRVVTSGWWVSIDQSIDLAVQLLDVDRHPVVARFLDHAPRPTALPIPKSNQSTVRPCTCVFGHSTITNRTR